MIDVEVKDFQSIESIKVKIEGFTALVGRSNIGKSALVRAIKYALTNALGTSFVRHGDMCARKLKEAKTCKCRSSVHIKTEGLDLLWEKGDGIGKYTLNGVEHTAVGAGMPDFLEKAGFAPLKIGSEKQSIQVADQFNPIFLLNVTGTSVAETISDVGRLDRINKAMRDVEKDRKEANATRKVREKDVVDLTQRLLPYSSLDFHIRDVRNAEMAYQKVSDTHDKVKKLDQYLASFNTLRSSIVQISRALEKSPPEWVKLVPTKVKLDQLDAYFAQLTQKANSYRSLLWVEKLPTLSIDAFQAAAKKYTQLGVWYAQFRNYRDRFAQLEKAQAEKVPGVQPLKEKAARLQAIQAFTVRLSDLQSSLKRFDGLETKPLENAKILLEKSTALKAMSAFGVELTRLSKKVQLLETEYQNISTEELEVAKQFDEIGVCPTCAQDVQPLVTHA